MDDRADVTPEYEMKKFAYLVVVLGCKGFGKLSASAVLRKPGEAFMPSPM